MRDGEVPGEGMASPGIVDSEAGDGDGVGVAGSAGGFVGQ